MLPRVSWLIYMILINLTLLIFLHLVVHEIVKLSKSGKKHFAWRTPVSREKEHHNPVLAQTI